MKLYAAIAAVGVLLSTSLSASQFGTGFAVNPKGYFITCHHVIKNAGNILVHTPEGPVPARIIALDPANDLAVLKIEKWNGRFLGLTSADEVGYASEVTAAGFPDPTVLGINPKISKGIVNALSGVRDDPRYLQVSAPVQPGNSGGPLISSTGRVVGVVAAGLNSMDRMAQGGYLPQSVNYAIKTDLIFPILKNASVKLPRFLTMTNGHHKQVTRALGAIVLVEGLAPGKTRSALSHPAPPAGTPMARGSNTVHFPTLKQTSTNAPWVFPDSHARPLSTNELQSLPPEGLWRARNEIYLRRGFFFTTAEGQQFARQYGPYYQPKTPSVADIQRTMSPVEVANLQLIHAFEKQVAR
ncbi:MAG: trypsin-like peptidase domain-containing protein [Verrucomicrobiales bacterium]|nr:trypsin-like peptidase domain-containing protein [Verrucomicrobiales bacterium]